MINTLIGQQNFELIRDRIAEILSTEIANQATLEGHDLWTENIFVWLERTAPFDKTELPCINVSLSSGEFDNYKATGDNDGNYQFDIDVYTKGVYTSTDNGDTKSTVLLHRILGVCKTILTNEQYKSLGFDAKFIGNRNVGSIQIADPNSTRRENETESIRLGRLVFRVKCNETNTTAVPENLSSYATTVRLYNTAQGYFYSTNNTLPPTPPSCTVRATVINSNDTEIVWKNVTDLDSIIEIPDVTIKVVNSEQTEINSETVPGGINAEIEAPGVTITDGSDTFEQPAGTTYTCSGGPTEINVRNENSTYSVNTSSDLVLPNITANVIDSEGTIISSEEFPSVEDLSLVAPDGTVVIKNTANVTLGSQSVLSNGTIDKTLGNITFIDSDGSSNSVPTGQNITATPQVKDIFIKGIFAIGNDTMETLTIDSDTAGTYTSITDDGSSGSITLSKNGSAFAAFSSPLVLASTDTLVVKRTVTSAIGNFKLIGTYV